MWPVAGATLVYRLPTQVKADNGVVVGVDRNGGQYAYATGETGMIRQQKSKTLEARRKGYQHKLARHLEAAKKRPPKQRRSNRMERTRRKLAKTERKVANRRKHDNHTTSKTVVAIGGTVVTENLNVKGITAKGTVENPGRSVKAKSGVNRTVIQTGWSQFAHFTDYKPARIEFVPAHHTPARTATFAATGTRTAARHRRTLSAPDVGILITPTLMRQRTS